METLYDNGYATIKADNQMAIDDIKNYIFDNFDSIVNNSKNENVFKDNNLIKQIQSLYFDSTINKFSNELLKEMGINNYEILNIQLFIKHPKYKITCPHQDGAYFANPDKKIFTIWIPLQKVTTGNSCMYYLPKSHLNGLYEHKKSGNMVRTRTGVTGYSLEFCEEKLSDYVPCELEFGEFVIHHQLTLHYSSTNQTEQARYALTIIFSID